MKGNVMDTHPDRFGWRFWHLDDTGTRLLSPYSRKPLRWGQRCVSAGVIPDRTAPHTSRVCARTGEWCRRRSAAAGCTYIPSIPYFLAFLDEIYPGMPDPVAVPWAVTYGIATDRAADIAEDFGEPISYGVQRTARYFPMVICLNHPDPDMAAKLQRRYRAGVIPGVTPAILRAVERKARDKLAGAAPADLLTAADWSGPGAG
jgi:hypothetical protein